MTSEQGQAGGLDDAKKIADGVAGIFSAIQALGVSDREVESLCQVGAALTQNLANELEVVAADRRRVPVLGIVREG